MTTSIAIPLKPGAMLHLGTTRIRTRLSLMLFQVFKIPSAAPRTAIANVIAAGQVILKSLTCFRIDSSMPVYPGNVGRREKM
ncbi:hypothetical protein [Sphingopyxis sp. 2PD]|uniref:hypothetical protein n=1 Tax=Sphingopyxis sp. 2PD TaxID=2502196 RepID=UPI0010F4E795|nr:hypothetical protein [Sphingopyxis sp. 2PD]